MEEWFTGVPVRRYSYRVRSEEATTTNNELVGETDLPKIHSPAPVQTAMLRDREVSVANQSNESNHTCKEAAEPKKCAPSGLLQVVE